jgi:hypothetical protein
MNETDENNTNQKQRSDMPILQLNRLSYARINGRILESTNKRLDKYIIYATQRLNTEVTAGDVVEHGLKLLFERDTGFKDWLKKN